MISAKINPTKQEDPLLTVITNSFKLYKQSWGFVQLNLSTFLWLYILPFIFAFLVFLAILPVIGLETLTAESIEQINTATISAQTGIILVMGLIGFLTISAFVAIALIITQLRSVEGIKTTFREAIDLSLPFFWRFIGLGIVSAVLIIAGLFALILPGVIVAFLLILSTFVLIDQNTGIIQAIKNSARLVIANWKLVIGLLCIQILIGMFGTIPVFGAIISMVITITYLCLPAIIYKRALSATPAAKE